MFPICYGKSEGICTSHVMGPFGGISTSVRHFCVCQYIHFPLVHKSYQVLPIIVGCFFPGLDAYGCMLCFMLLTFSFLCSVFIMCLASTTTAMTATPGDLCPPVCHLLSTVTMATSLMGLTVTSGQHDVVLQSLLTPRNSGGAVGFATVPQQQLQSQMPLQAYAYYSMGLP